MHYISIKQTQPRAQAWILTLILKFKLELANVEIKVGLINARPVNSYQLKLLIYIMIIKILQ